MKNTKQVKLYIATNKKMSALYDYIEGAVYCRTIADADIVVFSGKLDVGTHLYDEKEYKFTVTNRKVDRREVKIFNTVRKDYPNKLLLGLNRGALLLTALSGGKVVQHVGGHHLAPPNQHGVIFSNGLYTQTESEHHQMMYPYFLNESEYDLLAWADHKRSKIYYKEELKEYDFEHLKEPESIFYNKTNSLCFQFNPENTPNIYALKHQVNFLIKKHLEICQKNKPELSAV